MDNKRPILAVSLNKDKDKDIIKHIETLENASFYVRRLIRKDIQGKEDDIKKFITEEIKRQLGNVTLQPDDVVAPSTPFDAKDITNMFDNMT